MYIYKHICICIYACVRISVYMYVYMYVYIYTRESLFVLSLSRLRVCACDCNSKTPADTLPRDCVCMCMRMCVCVCGYIDRQPGQNDKQKLNFPFGANRRQPLVEDGVGTHRETQRDTLGGYRSPLERVYAQGSGLSLLPSIGGMGKT